MYKCTDIPNVSNNDARLCGIARGQTALSHTMYGENFYTFTLEISRTSGVCDNIIITASERIMNGIDTSDGVWLCITGSFRSYNNRATGENAARMQRLLLTVFAREISPAQQQIPVNQLDLTGCLCKPAGYRMTPLGREISDILIAVNRSYNKSDYIPCIAWGRNARFARGLCVGQRIAISGRIQSRQYIKLEDGIENQRTAFEMSISRLSLADDPVLANADTLEQSEE